MRRFFFIIFVVALVAGACGDSETDDQPPATSGSPNTQATPPNGNASVQCLLAAVALNQLTFAESECNNDSFPHQGPTRSAAPGDEVSVDADGEAAIMVGGCGPVYVFENSGLKLSSCRRTDQGNVACTTAGTVGQSNQGCPVTIQTASALITHTNTFYTVTFDEESGTTLVTVLEGSVGVVPLDEAGEPAGEDVAVEADQALYTNPQGETIAGIPPGEAISLGEVTPVIEALGVTEQYEAVLFRAERLEVDSCALDVFDDVIVRPAGGFFDIPVREGGIGDLMVASGVDWPGLLEPEGRGGFIPRVGLVLHATPYNPEAALINAREMGVEGAFIEVIVVGADPVATGVGEWVTAHLQEIGFEISLTATETIADACEGLAKSAAEGIPTILVNP